MKAAISLLVAIFLAGCQTTNHITSAAQILTYEKDPNAEKLRPPSLCVPAIAYSRDISGPIYAWDLDKQLWK